MEGLFQYLKLAVRQLWRNPGFTVTVALTLALSIGANTAIFSIVNALLLNFPYTHPERMGTIYARTTGSESSDVRRTIDGEQWELLRDNVPSLISAVSALHSSGVNLETGSHVQYLRRTGLGTLFRCAGSIPFSDAISPRMRIVRTARGQSS